MQQFSNLSYQGIASTKTFTSVRTTMFMPQVGQADMSQLDRVNPAPSANHIKEQRDFEYLRSLRERFMIGPYGEIIDKVGNSETLKALCRGIPEGLVEEFFLQETVMTFFCKRLQVCKAMALDIVAVDDIDGQTGLPLETAWEVRLYLIRDPSDPKFIEYSRFESPFNPGHAMFMMRLEYANGILHFDRMLFTRDYVHVEHFKRSHHNHVAVVENAPFTPFPWHEIQAPGSYLPFPLLPSPENSSPGILQHEMQAPGSYMPFELDPSPENSSPGIVQQEMQAPGSYMPFQPHPSPENASPGIVQQESRPVYGVSPDEIFDFRAEFGTTSMSDLYGLSADEIFDLQAEFSTSLLLDGNG